MNYDHIRTFGRSNNTDLFWNSVQDSKISLREERYIIRKHRINQTRMNGSTKMENSRIETALQHASTTQQVIIGAGVISQVPTIIEKLFGGSTALIIADENTYLAAGKYLREILDAGGISVNGSFVFPGSPTLHAEYSNVLTVKNFLRNHHGVPIAVGSGTINDLAKLASHELKRRYMVVATAASMDGYTSFGASITHDGFKTSDDCDAPVAVVADLNVLADSPPEMSAWGYADLMGKITAGADWILADALEIKTIDPVVWSMVQAPLRGWLKDPEILRQGSHQSLHNLFEGLTISGIAMQAHKSSRPASGSEHQLSHLWEMLKIKTPDGGEVSHGTKVGIGTIASTALYEQLLGSYCDELDNAALIEQWPNFEEVRQSIRKTLKSPHIVERAIEESEAKYIDRVLLRDRLFKIKNRWTDIQARLQNQLFTTSEVRQYLVEAGAETDPVKIGVPLSELKVCYQKAQMIRKRYTIFDLAIETGQFRSAVNALFEPGGHWGPGHEY